MEKIKKLLLFITLISFLYSCGGASDAAKVLRNEKIRNTDEFFVKKRDPLILPPDYNTLPEPNTKGAPKKDSNDKIGKILTAKFRPCRSQIGGWKRIGCGSRD